MGISEHPDVAAALEAGYPRWNYGENKDTDEERMRFVEDHYPEFVKFAIAGDPDIVESFVLEPSMRYTDWLN